MMLDAVKVPFFINENMQYLGCDNPNSQSLQDAFDNDMTRYFSYPYDISYIFNSRGFRDSEWPTEDLNKHIWCIGDSATLGTGVSLEHRYSSLLPKAINVSRILADNEWITDNTISILMEVKPKLIVIQWSYYHRNYLGPEKHVPLKGAYGEILRSQMMKLKLALTSQDKFDSDYLFHLIQKVENLKNNTKVIHLLTPNFHVGFNFLDRVKNGVENCLHIDWIDDARDITFHYGIESHKIIADKITQLCHEKNINIW